MSYFISNIIERDKIIFFIIVSLQVLIKIDFALKLDIAKVILINISKKLI